MSLDNLNIRFVPCIALAAPFYDIFARPLYFATAKECTQVLLLGVVRGATNTTLLAFLCKSTVSVCVNNPLNAIYHLGQVFMTIDVCHLYSESRRIVD